MLLRWVDPPNPWPRVPPAGTPDSPGHRQRYGASCKAVSALSGEKVDTGCVPPGEAGDKAKPDRVLHQPQAGLPPDDSCRNLLFSAVEYGERGVPAHRPRGPR
jgi:hypothetical protein